MLQDCEIWVEKYRPKTLEDFIYSEKEKFKELLDPKKLPHLLLLSKSPGTGKTTLAKIIIGMLKADGLILNSSDDRKIEVVREKVNKFACSMSATPGIPRIIFMDEFDGMTGIAQDALRNVMETYYKNCRFILTANNEHKIIEPIKSRCVRIDLKTPEKSDILARLKHIVKAEKVKADEEVLQKIVDLNYPNIRDCIKQLQMLSMDKKEIKLSDVKPELVTEIEVYEMLKESKFLKARKLWLDKGMNAEDLLLNLFSLGLRDTHLSVKGKKDLVMLSAEHDYRMRLGDPEVQLCAFALGVIDILKKEWSNG